MLTPYIRGLMHHRLVVALVAASGVGVALTSRDVFLTPIAAATMAGIVIVLLQRVWRSHPWSGWKYVRIAQGLSMMAVPVAFSTGLSVNGEHLFEQAFSAPLPAGVRDLAVDANYLNPAGKRTILLRFTADGSTLSTLLAARGFHTDPQMEEVCGSDVPWAEVAGQAFGGFARIGGSAWDPVPCMARPCYRELQRTVSGSRVHTRVLWDAQTGSTYVLHTVR